MDAEVASGKHELIVPWVESAIAIGRSPIADDGVGEVRSVKVQITFLLTGRKQPLHLADNLTSFRCIGAVIRRQLLVVYGRGIPAERIASLTAPLTTSLTVASPNDCPHFTNLSLTVESFWA
jgi:hypothetical protein